MQQQTIQDIETQANQLLESVYQRKSESITSYSKLKRQEEALDLGFASVGFPDESMDCEAVYEILQPGFIFEVIVSKKNIAKGRLDVVLQKFLAFSDKCLTSQHQVRQADFQQFKKQKHLLSQLSQINVMRMKGVIYEQDVIEDFSIFTYYINFEKIQVGDHLNAVLIDKTKMTMSLKNKSIMGGKQWSLKSLQNPSHFDNWLYFRLGYAKQIGVNFQYQIMNEEERQKAQESINANLKFKEETGWILFKQVELSFHDVITRIISEYIIHKQKQLKIIHEDKFRSQKALSSLSVQPDIQQIYVRKQKSQSNN